MFIRWSTSSSAPPRTARTRQRVAPEWQAIVEGGFGDGAAAGAAADLYRVEREARARLTTSQLAAYVARGMAERRLFGLDETPDTALDRAVGAARETRTRDGRTVFDRADAHLDAFRAAHAASMARRERALTEQNIASAVVEAAA